MQKWNVICVMLKRNDRLRRLKRGSDMSLFQGLTDAHRLWGIDVIKTTIDCEWQSDWYWRKHADKQTRHANRKTHKLFSSYGPERFPLPPQPPLFSCRVDKCNRMVSFYHQNPHGPTDRKTEWGWRGAGWRSPWRIRPATRSTERSDGGLLMLSVSLSATSQEGNQLRVVETKVKDPNEGCK